MKKLKKCIQVFMLIGFLFQVNNAISQCYITPGLVTTQNYVGCQAYEVYVTSGTNIVNYDRTVEIMFTQGTDILEVAIVTIPAGQHLSNNVQVFNNHPTQVGTVVMAVVNVTRPDGSIDNSCIWRTINTSIQNCPRPRQTDNSQPGLIDIEAELRGSRTP